MGVKVRGVREAKANLNRIIDNIQGRKVVRAIQSALILGSSRAAYYTPIDSSTLLVWHLSMRSAGWLGQR